jgi:hypothetical protein
MRAGAILIAGWTAFSALAFAAPAAAQELRAPDEAAASAPADAVDGATPAEAAAPPNETLPSDEQLANALTFDPATLAAGTPERSLRVPRLSGPKDLDISRTDRANGSGTVVVKKPLAADEWDATVGADVNLAAAPSDDAQLDRPQPSAADTGGSGAAWASIGVPNVASLDARVDAANDHGRIGTTLKRSVPLGSRFSVTVQDTYSVTETFNPLANTAANQPLLETAPAASPTPQQVYGNERLAKLDYLPTGTTLSAALSSTSTDPVTHRTFSADQKIYGPLHVTTAVTDIGEPSANKSISARFKLNW